MRFRHSRGAYKEAAIEVVESLNTVIWATKSWPQESSEPLGDVVHNGLSPREMATANSEKEWPIRVICQRVTAEPEKWLEQPWSL
jgi:hypothetical protein